MRSPCLACTALSLLALTQLVPQDEPEPVRLEGGGLRFEWVEDWLQLPEGTALGNTHGAVLGDGDGHVWFNTDAEHAVVVAGTDGSWQRAFGKDLKGGLHGMTLVTEGEERFLYAVHTGQGALVKLTAAGEEVWRLGCPMESGKYDDPKQYKPTSVAVAPDGRIYVADGYGRSWIHLFSPDRKYVRSFGGPGSEPGQLRTPHGLHLDTRGETPRLLVADRENHRLQAFDLDGEHLEVIEAELRRPCNIDEHEGLLVVADLVGRITILDADDALVAHLGDNEDPAKRANHGVPPDQWRAGQFTAPHGAAWDEEGNLYVEDWNANGRINKLRRVRD